MRRSQEDLELRALLDSLKEMQALILEGTGGTLQSLVVNAQQYRDFNILGHMTHGA